MQCASHFRQHLTISKSGCVGKRTARHSRTTRFLARVGEQEATSQQEMSASRLGLIRARKQAQHTQPLSPTSFKEIRTFTYTRRSVKLLRAPLRDYPANPSLAAGSRTRPPPSRLRGRDSFVTALSRGVTSIPPFSLPPPRSRDGRRGTAPPVSEARGGARARRVRPAPLLALRHAPVRWRRRANGRSALVREKSLSGRWLCRAFPSAFLRRMKLPAVTRGQRHPGTEDLPLSALRRGRYPQPNGPSGGGWTSFLLPARRNHYDPVVPKNHAPWPSHEKAGGHGSVRLVREVPFFQCRLRPQLGALVTQRHP